MTAGPSAIPPTIALVVGSVPTVGCPAGTFSVSILMRPSLFPGFGGSLPVAILIPGPGVICFAGLSQIVLSDWLALHQESQWQK